MSLAATLYQRGSARLRPLLLVQQLQFGSGRLLSSELLLLQRSPPDICAAWYPEWE